MKNKSSAKSAAQTARFQITREEFVTVPSLRAKIDSALASLADAISLLDDEAYDVFLARRLARRMFSSSITPSSFAGVIHFSSERSEFEMLERISPMVRREMSTHATT
jgi:hypothetical protein